VFPAQKNAIDGAPATLHRHPVPAQVIQKNY
jgi:hypothetical protein